MKLLLAIIILAVTAYAQQLPDELIFHRQTEEHEYDDDDGEPAAVHVSVNQTFFDGALTSINDIIYAAEFGNVSVEQGMLYELRRDRLKNMRHFSNMSGGLKYQLENYRRLTPGLDWTPIMQYSSDRGGRNALNTVDFGPTLGIDAYGVPVNLRAGISGRRVDSFDTDDESRSSTGTYGAFNIGSWDEVSPLAPVYFYGNAIGRQIESSSMTFLSSAARGALQFGERDSLFVYGYVSLFNGREGYLESTADNRVALFTETPWRLERDVSAIAGYKGAPKSIVMPSLYYSVSENTLSFLNDTRRLRDEKTLRQILCGAISTDSAAGLYYSGAISFEWRDHDKLFGKKIATVSTPENIDSLEINLWSYSAFEPRTTHSLALKLPLSLRLKYDFSLTRSLTEYPNYYISGRDSITNKDDSDRRTRQQRLALEYKNDSTFRAEFFGEFIDYDLIFLKQAKSGSNRTDNTQRVGLILEWAPMNELLITEIISAEAKRGNFHFPAFHQRALQRPRYSRAVNSSLAAIWQAASLIGFTGQWNIKFSDYGFWYGREYMEEALAQDSNTRTDYYAITSKSVYYTIDAAVRWTPRDIIVETGSAITSANDRHYESGNYIKANADGYTVKPYISTMFRMGGWGEITAHLSHTFVIGNRALGYWDFRLQAECWF